MMTPERSILGEYLPLVREIQWKHAAAIIADGVFSDSVPLWINLIADLAAPKAADLAKALGDVDSFELTHVTNVWAEMGFAVGLAVGMQLGPHAFGGIEPKGKPR
jgi:hypothetical protein